MQNVSCPVFMVHISFFIDECAEPPTWALDRLQLVGQRGVEACRYHKLQQRLVPVLGAQGLHSLAGTESTTQKCIGFRV